MKAFDFIIIKHPTKRERDNGGVDKILVGPKTILAPDQNGASMLAGREIPEAELVNLGQLEVAVRPF